MQTWLLTLVTVVQRWGFCIAAEPSLMKVNVADSSWTLVVTRGGTSLMTHNRKAEGIEKPGAINNEKLIKQGYFLSVN